MSGAPWRLPVNLERVPPPLLGAITLPPLTKSYHYTYHSTLDLGQFFLHFVPVMLIFGRVNG